MSPDTPWRVAVAMLLLWAGIAGADTATVVLAVEGMT